MLMQEARLALVPPEVLKMPFGRSIGSAVSAYTVKGMQKKYKGVDGKSTLEKVSLRTTTGSHLDRELYADIKNESWECT